MKSIWKNKGTAPPAVNAEVPPHTPRYRVKTESRGTVRGIRQDTNGVRRTSMKPSRTVNAHRNVVPVQIETDKSPRLIERLYSWRLGFSINTESLVKVLVISALLVLFTVLQTTFFSRFRLFGKVPDLMLPFVITVGVLEREKYGAVCALASAFVIEAVTGSQMTLLPLLYVPCAVTVAMLTANRFRDSAPVMAVYVLSASCLRAVLSFIVLLCTVKGIGAAAALFENVMPEFAATLLFSAVPQLITRAALKPFHKTRAERTGRSKV